ncbi:hypothetical protein W97_03089 [Coniosporium apollinis CBS 100218]|uniref:CBF1-interacting co-repressor CIR N-terminal domain-containing protein n=1 Tax=Coniosporium apollinis (strain CBS 100218) TaxID=1168221 RepID=R7YQB0_CONA1|nr:uncharacterized protein W97_03089 [Coniosporium apollinis CBS 100218]EON63861.1 hypothetical protein W97_03089 [Coniosporium apollinis CBS 100218]
MPLNLLSKKSWNVYAPANIERVKRDEAAAAAREAEAERRMQEADAERRIAILRGEQPPPLPVEDVEKPERKRDRDGDREGRGGERKRRRLAGEDDTDRDLRLAREDAAKVAAARGTALTSTGGKKSGTSDAPLMDRDGHISLFPVDPRALHRAEKNAEAEAEKAKKKLELEDQYTMRFSNAAGKAGLERPWYADAAARDVRSGSVGLSREGLGEVGKDVWGNADPGRKERERIRAGASDPLAFMQRAQTQLKQSERDRLKWAEEREREVRALEEREARRERRKRRRARSEREEDHLEGFSLDAAVDLRIDGAQSKSHRRGRSKHELHRSGSRSRSRTMSGDGHNDHGRLDRRSRNRSRSHDQDRERKPGHRSGHIYERPSRGSGTLAESLLARFDMPQ